MNSCPGYAAALAVILGLTAALGIGSSDLFGRRLVAASSVLTAAAVMQVWSGLFTTGIAAATASPFQSGPFVWGCVSGLGIGSGLGLYYRGLQKSSATVVAPLSASIASVVPYWYAVLGASGATVLAVAGVGVAIVGLVLVTGGAISADRLLAGVQYGVASGLAYAATTIAFLEAPDGEGLWPVAGQRTVGALILLTASILFGHRLWPPAGQGFNGIASGALMAMVSISLLAALALDAAPASVALSTYPVFSVTVGRVFFADPLQRSQIAGIGLVVAGIAAVSVG